MSLGVALRRPRPGDPSWRPLLMRAPDGLRERDAAAEPRVYQLTAIGLLLLFLALQFLIPARLVIAGMGAAGRPSVALGLLLLVLWGLSAIRRNGLPAGRQPVRWIVGVYVAAQLLGYAVGFDRQPLAIEARSADRWLILTFAMAGVALAIADAPRRRRDLDVVLRCLVFLTAVMAVVGILQYLHIVDLVQYVRIPGLSANSDGLGERLRGDGNYARVAGTANHFIEFGVVLALVLPIAVHYAMFPPPGSRHRWLRWTFVALIAGGIPMSISRSAVLTAAIGMTVLVSAWTWRQRYNALAIALAGAAVMHVLTRGLFGTIRSLFLNAGYDPSIQNRLSDVPTVIELWRTNPLLGRGAGMIIPEVYLLLDNQFYVTLIAGGVLGVLVLAGFYLVPFALARSVRLRAHREEDRHLGQALAATFPAAMLASATFDSFSFATYVGVVFVLLGAVGALWRFTRGAVPPGTQQPLVSLETDRVLGAPLMAPNHPRWRTWPLAPRQASGSSEQPLPPSEARHAGSAQGRAGR